MIRQTTERLICINYLFILVAMFSSCSLLLACKVDSVTLKAGATASEAKDSGTSSLDIPVGDTAYFYATCTVSEDPDPNDIKWKFDLDGDGTYEFSTTTEHDVLCVEPNEINNTYSDPNLYNIKACACIDNGDNDWSAPGSCTVTAVGVEKVVKDGTDNDATIYVCLGGTVDLEAIPDPNTASFPSGEPTWEITSQPSGSDPNLSPSTGRHTTVIDLDVPGDYDVEATCGTDSDSITITVVEVESLEPDIGDEFDDGDGDPNTKSYAVCIADTGVVTVSATPNPIMSESDLPTGWSLSGGTGSGKLVRTVDKTTAGATTLTCTCGTSSKMTTIYVVEVASLLPDEGTEIDDGDNDPNTKRYFLFKAASGNVNVTATPNPNIGEPNLPSCWNLTGGTTVTDVLHTVDKTTAGTTDITCTAGSSVKKVKFHVIEVEVDSVGFTNDHMITEWGGGAIDDPDGSSAIWTQGGTDDPVCYTKNTSPTMFAGFIVSPGIAAPKITGISIRAKVSTTVIGSASGCKLIGTAMEDASNTDGDVDGISGGSAVPGGDGVKTTSTTLTWEVSSNGSDWFSADSSGAHTMHWTDATPAASTLYDLGLEKACGYVSGAADIPGEINTGIDGDVSYVPTGCTSHTLGIFSAGSGQCCCHAAIFCELIEHVTADSPSPTDAWGGCSSSNHCHFKYGPWWGPTFRCDRSAHDSAAAFPHFNYHVEVSYGGTVYDPSYGLTGWATFTEMAQVVAGSHTTAATQQTGSSYPPGTTHLVNWTCPH